MAWSAGKRPCFKFFHSEVTPRGSRSCSNFLPYDTKRIWSGYDAVFMIMFVWFCSPTDKFIIKFSFSSTALWNAFRGCASFVQIALRFISLFQNSESLETLPLLKSTVNVICACVCDVIWCDLMWCEVHVSRVSKAYVLVLHIQVSSL